jgi:esterase
VHLFVDRIARKEGPAERRAVFLHGILGSGQNLRTVARRFTELCPGWDAAVVDLRGHGRSVPIGAGAPTIATVAADVLETLGGEPVPVAAVIGHSFGGKVALEVARRWGPGGTARGDGRVLPLDHVVVMDSLPGARPTRHGSESIAQVLETLDALAHPFPDRNAFVAAVEARGHGKPIAQWLATSLKRQDDGTFLFGVDLAFVREVLGDYFALDLWPLLEDAPETGGLSGVHLVIGGRSTVFLPPDRARASELERRGRLTVDVLDAGHWLHAEDPESVIAVLARRIGGAA